MSGDENLADLIKRKTGIDWNEVKNQIKEMSTAELIDLMVELGLYVNKTLALEIAGRKDAVFWLRRLIQKGIYWYSGYPGDAWSPIHAIHILALIKSKEALELLLDVVRYRGEDLSDWLTENVPSLLVAFGDIERLKEFARDETLEPFARGTATTALAVLARKNPEYKNEVIEYLKELLENTRDPVFAGNVINDLLSFHDTSVMPAIKRAFKEGRVDTHLMNEKDVEFLINYDEFELHTKNPLDHFSRKNIEYLHSIHYADEKKHYVGSKKKKIGRNDPCPCGSGKKYKKCCMLKERK